MGYRKNVFVLGAGFSVDAGAPLMDDFFRCARDLRDDPKSALTDHDKVIFSRIIEYRFGLNRALAKILVDLDNIEQLFGFLEMDLQLSGKLNAELRKDMKYLIGRTLEVSTQKQAPRATCYLLMKVAAGGFRQHPVTDSPYAFFLGLASGLWNPDKRMMGDAVDAIISFNYDLVLEREMTKLKIRPSYHCGGDNVSYWKDAFNPYEHRIKLLKLHGSVNWLTCGNCNLLHFLSPKDVGTANVGNYACDKCRQFTLQPLIVPPTWNKGIEEGFLRSVWSQALAEMTTAGRLFIVGYSFPETDQFFKYMLGLALAHNDQLTEVHVVNPSTQVWDTFRKQFNPYFEKRVAKFHQQATLNFIPDIQSLSRQEIDEATLNSNLV